MQPSLFLASTSPRRRELLQQLGLVFSVQPISVDESRLPQESNADYVGRLAYHKAAAGLALLPPGAVVLAADTTVALDDFHELGKPAFESEARAMWTALSGREHRVFTGVAVMSRTADGAVKKHSTVVTTVVRFRDIAPEEMTAYWASGEPADKAGSYAIQGRGAVFVTGIEGSYSNVVGLPLAETAALLAQFGISVWNDGRQKNGSMV